MNTTNYQVSAELQAELKSFLTSCNVADLNQNLRRQFIDYLEYELHTGIPVYFDDFLYPLNTLFDFLDKAAKDVNDYKMSKVDGARNSLTKASSKEKIIEFIVATISPEKIFLLDHQEENNQEYFDLLVVIPDTNQTRFSHYEEVISMARIDNVELHVSLHKSCVIERQIEDGHIYFAVSCAEGSLIYDDGKTSLPSVKTERRHEIKSNAIQAFKAAFNKANNFLGASNNYYGDSEKEMSVFMQHQAIELILRGLLTSILGSCVRTHSLKELKKNCHRYFHEIRYIFSPDEEQENRLLTLLEKSYFEARYNDQFKIEDEDYLLLVKSIKNFIPQVEKIFNKKISMLS